MLAAGSGRIGKAGSEIGAVFGTIRAEHLSIRICYGAMDTHVAFVHAQSVESPSNHARARSHGLTAQTGEHGRDHGRLTREKHVCLLSGTGRPLRGRDIQLLCLELV